MTIEFNATRLVNFIRTPNFKQKADIENPDQTENVVGIGSEKEIILRKLEEVRASSGKSVYHLYAVMVHRGGLTGGHYYVFILDFESYQWYRCDDSNVRKVSAVH
jgi:ubiquitin carboxyl-terminal hydrolase 25/28